MIMVQLREDATEVQKETIEARLGALPGVTEVRFVSRQEAYRRFRELSRERSGPIEDIGPEDLPESITVRLTDPAVSTTVVQTAQTLPGVQQATTLPAPAPS